MSVDTIPLDENNLAIKGARAVIEALCPDGKFIKNCSLEDGDAVSIEIDKQLPVAAGIAGGSGNAAAAMLGINAIAGYPFSLRELMAIGAKVGADVPYSLMMNAKKNEAVLKDLPGIEEASSAAMMSGIGDIVQPVAPIMRHVIMINPGISVSTREAYESIDALKDYNDAAGLFTNQLEKFTLTNYWEARELKTAMTEYLRADTVLMSGSGPTMIAYYTDAALARMDYEQMICSDWFRSEWRAWLTVTGGSDKEE